MSQFHRLVYIDKMIKEFGQVTKKQVIDEFQVKIGTVKNDFRYMKFEVNSPIVYSRKKKAYHYKDDGFELFSFRQEKIFLFFVLLKQLLHHETLMPLDPTNILELIKRDVDPEYLKLETKISYELSEFEYPDMEKFARIVGSMLRKFTLNIKYLGAKGKKSSRAIEPFHIFYYQGKWYVLAHCRKKDELRMFLLSRIVKIDDKNSEKFSCKRYKAKELRDFLNDSFGIARGKEADTAVIRFYEPVMYHIRDQRWHKDQKVKVVDNDKEKYIQFTLPVAKYEELVGRVLRFSPDAEIIAPQAMREMWLSKLKLSLNKYN
ncbi:MAG: WYL domain-containing protein [Candidatus Delongbacteria bacterium]|nr:WYL domain-containing protein [Candidatus Delongbacteria bacterium]